MSQSKMNALDFRSPKLSETHERRKAWPAVRALVTPLFKEAMADANAFPGLDVIYDASSATNPNGMNFVSLWYGSHPIGSERDGDGEVLITESGCTLSVGQDIRGRVFVFLTPFRSDASSPDEDAVVLKVFRKPAKLRRRHVRSALRTLNSYAQVTAVHGSPTGVDSVRVGFVRAKSRVMADPLKIPAALLGLVVKTALAHL